MHIRDMHRLLTSKGYRFTSLDEQTVQMLTAAENQTLKTVDELEAEDREAQAAKLQELIRRGTPRDLQAAQELMEIMSGAPNKVRPDYKAMVNAELDKVQNEALLLNEMLTNAEPGEKFVPGDAFEQLASKCTSVQPKIQNWISSAEETDVDLERLLFINDLINSVKTRYDAYLRGDRTTADALIAQQTAPQKPVNLLIDFEDTDEPITSVKLNSPLAQPVTSLADDLLGLSIGPSGSSNIQTGFAVQIDQVTPVVKEDQGDNKKSTKDDFADLLA